MPKRPFDEAGLPSFEASPAVVLVSGDLPFFIEEAAARVTAGLTDSATEVVELDDEASPETISDALLNRSLFSPRRVVRLDISRLVGSEKPAELLDGALEAWARGGAAGRRLAFRGVRALLASQGVPRGEDPAETAAAVTRKLKRASDADALAAILRELPEDRGSSSGAVVKSALRVLLDRGSDGVVAVATAFKPPAESELVREIRDKGLLLEVSVAAAPGPALARFAESIAREHEVTLEPGVVRLLLERTNSRPDQFAADLAKLLQGAGKGGRLVPSDVREEVEDAASEDVYAFFDAIGRRDAGLALGRLERLFSGREVRAGKREVDADEDFWPFVFLGMLAGEVRRMLYIRAVLDTPGAPRYDAGLSPDAFSARFADRLEAPVPPFDRGPFPKSNVYVWYKAAQRASRFETAELARALARAAEVDVKMKNSTSPLAALSSYVGDLIAGA